MKYMTTNLKEILIKEGAQKLDYFKKRIRDMKIMISNKINNKNKYKQIILNKLEEEKGEKFKEIENKSNGFYLYEQKHRKRLKTSTLNENFKNIYINNEFNNNKYSNYLFTMKQYKNNIENNYNNKEYKNFKFIPQISVKKNKTKDKTNIRLFQNLEHFIKYNGPNIFLRNKDFSLSKMLTKINSSLIRNNKEQMHSKIKSDEIKYSFNKRNKDIYMKDIEIKNKISCDKIYNRNLNHIEYTPKKDIMKIMLSRKFIPKTPNEKILKAYCNLCKTQPNKKNSLKIKENNDINYCNTQNYSSFNQNDKSINESLTKEKTIFALKTYGNKINLKKTIPLLTEFVSNKKDLTLRGFSLKKQNNYNVSYK